MAAFAVGFDRWAASSPGYRRVARLAQAWSHIRRAPLDPKRTIVVADFHPPAAMLLNWLGGLPARMALPFVPDDPLPGVDYTLLNVDVNPMTWGSDADRDVPGRIDTVASLLTWELVTGQTMRRWWKMKIKRVWFLREDLKVSIPPVLGAAGKAAIRLAKKVWHGPVARYYEQKSRELLAACPERDIARRPGNKLRIVHYIWSLDSGGAERQLCNTAIAQKRDGHDVRVFLLRPPIGQRGHYLPLLEKAGIPTRGAGTNVRRDLLDRWDRESRELSGLPLQIRELREPVLDLAGELFVEPADVLQCWLDDPNIVGFLAGRIAGTPSIILSLRNVSPRWQPHFLHPWMWPCYRVAAGEANVTMVANSVAGARDYEQWLGLASGKVGVLLNAFVPPAAPDPGEVARFRREMGCTGETPIVTGVLRLSPEKRPLMFLDVVARLQHRVPDVEAVLVGHGIMENEVRAHVRRLGLEKVVHLLGQRSDVPVILSASDVLLLTSQSEGLPNAVIEAQHFGCVPVATDVGGVAETLLPDRSGVVCGADDVEGLAAAAAALLGDPPRRAAMAEAGRAFVARQFDPRTIHAQTMAMYVDALARNRCSSKLAG